MSLLPTVPATNPTSYMKARYVTIFFLLVKICNKGSGYFRQTPYIDTMRGSREGWGNVSVCTPFLTKFKFFKMSESRPRTPMENIAPPPPPLKFFGWRRALLKRCIFVINSAATVRTCSFIRWWLYNSLCIFMEGNRIQISRHENL